MSIPTNCGLRIAPKLEPDGSYPAGFIKWRNQDAEECERITKAIEANPDDPLPCYQYALIEDNWAVPELAYRYFKMFLDRICKDPEMQKLADSIPYGKPSSSLENYESSDKYFDELRPKAGKPLPTNLERITYAKKRMGELSQFASLRKK